MLVLSIFENLSREKNPRLQLAVLIIYMLLWPECNTRHSLQLSKVKVNVSKLINEKTIF